VRHRLGLATRTQISVCKSPFPSAGTAVSLVRAKTVQQRPLLPNNTTTKFYIARADSAPLTTPHAPMSLIDSPGPGVVTRCPGSNYLLFQQILPTLDFFYLLDCLMITGLDYFIFSFTF